MSRTLPIFLLLSLGLHAGLALFVLGRGRPPTAAAAMDSTHSPPIFLETVRAGAPKSARLARPRSREIPRMESTAADASAAKESAAAAGGDGLAPYLENVRELLRARQVYPEGALADGEAGIVEVGFRIARTGEVTDLRLTKPSAHARLNRAALEIFRGLPSFPALPAGVAGSEVSVKIPFEYALE